MDHEFLSGAVFECFAERLCEGELYSLGLSVHIAVHTDEEGRVGRLGLPKLSRVRTSRLSLIANLTE